MTLLISLYSDIDECALGLDNCHADASCGDAIGSFVCTCNPGYTGDGVTCTSEYKLHIIS